MDCDEKEPLLRTRNRLQNVLSSNFGSTSPARDPASVLNRRDQPQEDQIQGELAGSPGLTGESISRDVNRGSRVPSSQPYLPSQARGLADWDVGDSASLDNLSSRSASTAPYYSSASYAREAEDSTEWMEIPPGFSDFSLNTPLTTILVQ